MLVTFRDSEAFSSRSPFLRRKIQARSHQYESWKVFDSSHVDFFGGETQKKGQQKCKSLNLYCFFHFQQKKLHVCFHQQICMDFINASTFSRRSRFPRFHTLPDSPASHWKAHSTDSRPGGLKDQQTGDPGCDPRP